ncbi:hypothetical protein JCM3765_003730 [Sporobolomyces pararoseus]
MSTASAAAAPQTLEAALERINHLEDQLALAHRLFHQHSVGNKNLSDYLSTSTEASPSPPYRSVSQPSSSNDDSSESPSPHLKGKGVDKPPTQPTSGGAANGSRTAPVDIGAFVLRALALRKNLTIGVVDPLEAEAEFKKIVGGSGLNSKQVAQVREWSGLQ